jgi:hypothetical protein
MIGRLAPRSVLLSPVTLSSALASHWPSETTKTVSCPPTVATGRIGTPERIACFTKPVRPPRVATSRLRQLRMESISPPGQTTTSFPAARVAPTLFRWAAITPTARK